jgi:hypothetical protein
MVVLTPFGRVIQVPGRVVAKRWSSGWGQPVRAKGIPVLKALRMGPDPLRANWSTGRRT